MQRMFLKLRHYIKLVVSVIHPRCNKSFQSTAFVGELEHVMMMNTDVQNSKKTVPHSVRDHCRLALSTGTYYCA